MFTGTLVSSSVMMCVMALLCFTRRWPSWTSTTSTVPSHSPWLDEVPVPMEPVNVESSTLQVMTSPASTPHVASIA